MGQKDVLWKGLLEWVFEDLLRFLYPDAEEIFDLKKGFVYLDKELAQLHLDPDGADSVRHVDKLIKAYRKDGSEEWVLIHLEVQGETKARERPHFGERMFRYFYRIFDHYKKPLVAIAIFTGQDAGNLPDRFEYSFLNTRLQYVYRTLNIRDYSDEELLASDNPFALVILIARQALLRGKNLDNRLLEGKLFIFRKLYEKGLMNKKKLQVILGFLDKYIQFANKETTRIFKEKIDQFTNKPNTMDFFEQIKDIVKEEYREEGREKGREEGRQEMKDTFARKMLESGKWSADDVATLVEIPLSEVMKIRETL